MRRRLNFAGILFACFCAISPVLADPTAASSAGGAHADTGAIPPGIKTLITGFNQTRDKYLAAQAGLLAELKDATAPEERDEIRAQLQDNRQAFLAQLQEFRAQLKEDLTELKGKVSHEEFLRIMEAARSGIHHHHAQ